MSACSYPTSRAGTWSSRYPPPQPGRYPLPSRHRSRSRSGSRSRTARELERIVKANPFIEPGTDLRLLHFGFLVNRPSAARVATLDPDRSPPDAFTLRERELYLRCPNGMARTKLTNAYFDARLQTVTTIRNWRTTLRLLELSGTRARRQTW